MGFEEKQVRHILGTPRREEEASVFPPVGQLAFDRIKRMDEGELDRALLERHGLRHIFKREEHYSGQTEHWKNRRAEIKKLTLARLEGMGLGGSSPVSGWYAETHGYVDDLENTMRSTLSQSLTDECKQRINEVLTHVARAAALIMPTSGIQKLEKQIEEKLRSTGYPPLNASAIFNAKRLPTQTGDGLRGRVLDVETGLKLYLLKLSGLSNSECAERLRSDEKIISSFWTIYYSSEAKALVRRVRGYRN